MPVFSEDNSGNMDASGQPIVAAPGDPAIRQALKEISPTQIRQSIEKLVSFHNRNTLSSMDTNLASGQGVTAAADWIAAEFQRYSVACGGCLEVKRDSFTQQPEPPPQGRIPKPTTITNVYAILRGSDPSQAARMVLVTGHYDSRNTGPMETEAEAPGANDDASGVAVSLECARVLANMRAKGLKLPATLVFVAVAGEEQGLNGSLHLAEFAKSEGWQLEGVLNNDIVGGNTTPGETLQDKSAVRVFSEGIPATATPAEIKRIMGLGAESDSPSRELARSVVEVSRSYFATPSKDGSRAQSGASALQAFHPVLIFRRDRYLRGGDHTSFNQEGFAAVRFTEWREDYNHQHQDVRTEKGVEYGDLLKFVDYSYVANVARLNAATLATLASAPAPPQNVTIVTKNLDNNTTLHWAAGLGAPANTAYEVVWRETSAPLWQRSLEVAPQSAGILAVTLPVSKDNVIFGVRALDPAGHRSIAVTPVPER
ncbi:Leucine aminopeptidase-related protein [Acidisarcina polymorpha]|uniref:Leucine aminopeptidase-related protein n=1 Tax=Acidisarcina polymorpha TaxID=2211140 RepID=A0A2Z5FSV7_9BACT|nr:M20/M25/M40 family metallo-hydrolase [Acidisarcina polymorpha]AXC09556.1 Leucine aminopeptidase-related protein [Acidisarcina polymorpha]